MKPSSSARLAELVLVALGRLPRPGWDDRLLRRLNRPELRDAYMLWQHLRGGTGLREWLPRLNAFELQTLSGAPHAFVLVAEGRADRPALRFTYFGSALAARLGRSLVGETVGPGNDANDVFGGMADAYARCAKTRVPHYDYARCGFGEGGEPLIFERLLLPVASDAGAAATHVIGLAMFSGPVSAGASDAA